MQNSTNFYLVVSFKVQFAPDVMGGFVTQLPYLRYHICLEDARYRQPL